MIGRPVLVVVTFLFFVMAVSDLHTEHRNEGKRQLEDALRRTAVAVYASEGVYPPDLAYMQEHYGIRIDETRYKVIYEVIGSNLMPDITVIDREP